jgi:uncharacterized protein (DUF952 family)
MRIFHIVPPVTWSAAQETGQYTSADFAADGFVHFSFARQVARVANAIYRDEPELVVVEVESDVVPAELLRVEGCYESGETFPHVYGPIPVSAARSITQLTRDAGGDWEFTAPGGATAPASPGQ